MKNILDYKLYLFDLDGTFVSSEKLKGEALAKTCQLAGGNVTSNIYKQVMGNSWEHVRDHFCETSSITIEPDRFDKSFAHIYKELLLNKIDSTPGAVELINSLKENKKKVGLVTSSKAWMVDKILKNINFINHFDLIITNENVKQQKPNPEAYLLSLKHFNIAAQDTIVFEDTEAGIQAGNAAGCDVIALRHGLNELHDFTAAKKIINEFYELL